MDLKGGASTNDSRLDRVYELDWRSLDHPISAVMSADQVRTPRSYTWRCDTFLDQGHEGACVGFGYSHELAAHPVVVADLTDETARALYWQVQQEDPWPGGSYPGADPQYEGTSVLTGAKVVTDQGHYTSYRWAMSIEELASGIGFTGPAVLGVNWYTGMFDTDDRGFIHVTGQVEGGHCILAKGVHVSWTAADHSWDTVDRGESYVVLHNSWGQSWGVGGVAKISLDDLARLLSEDGEACFPRRRRT